MTAPLSLFICTSPRSGSYFFSDLLTRNGLPFGDEWFTPFQQGSKTKQYGLGDNASCSEYLKALSARERSAGKFVIKVMYPNFRQMMERLVEESDAVSEDALLESISSIFPNPKFVFLRRRDRVAQAISHLIAKQTGIWVKPKHQKQKIRYQPVYSYTAIATTMRRRAQNEDLWEQFFKQQQVDPFRIFYEDLRGNQEAVLQALFDWLQLPMIRKQEAVEPERFSVMSTSVNAEWKQRYTEEQALCADRSPKATREALDNLKITGTTLRDTFTVSDPFSFTVHLEYKGNSPINFRGDPNGDGWLMVLCSMHWGVRKEFFQQEIRPDSEGRLNAEFVLPGPRKPGFYNLQLTIADRVLSHEQIRSNSTYSKDLQFTLPEQRQQCRDLIPGIEDLPNGWQSIDWFGCFLDTQFPWLYHVDHEWLYIKPHLQQNGTYHILDMHLGWVEIDPDTYPIMKSLETNQTWVFKLRENNIRLLETIPQGDSLRIPTNSSADLQRLNRKPTEE